MEATMPDISVQLEMSFLEHRLEVIEMWPDSRRKAATRVAILERLEMLPRGPHAGQASQSAEAVRFRNAPEYG
jgi:hypothetical protein